MSKLISPDKIFISALVSPLRQSVVGRLLSCVQLFVFFIICFVRTQNEKCECRSRVLLFVVSFLIEEEDRVVCHFPDYNIALQLFNYNE